ncbi:hypothetical protein [Virgibacillus siamensis]|uniref:hypothetical protein n=1 Tax=Virgibacillus siamensis TaxID=480071 RepID=UPI0009855BFB|nr:hypothetical protein [Virgibacillus siamensis]
MIDVKDMKSNKFYGEGIYILVFENKFCEEERHKLFIKDEKEFTEILIDTRLRNNYVELFTRYYAKYLGIGFTE